jgi:hypothetical protein
MADEPNPADEKRREGLVASELAKPEIVSDKQPEGLLAIVGLFSDIEGFDTIMDEVVAERAAAEHREVDLG